MTNSGLVASDLGSRVTAHAVHLADRINTVGFEAEALSSVPLAIRAGAHGVAVLFRYGVAVMIGVSTAEEAELLQRLDSRLGGKIERREEETASVELAREGEDQVSAGGPVLMRDMSVERLLVVSDVLAKSVSLASDEREVAKVFEVIEPFARELARKGNTGRDRRGMLKLIGNALLVRQRLAGRVAITEKPDALWDRPDLERLYARLEDEYELRERVDALDRKLTVIAETANTLSDIIDTRRSLRLEMIVVFLIAFEIVITFYQIYVQRGH